MAHGLTTTANEEQYGYPQADQAPHISPRHTHLSQRLRLYALLACGTRCATELDAPVQGAQHQIIDAEKYPNVE